jgi:AraC-like DNA-binding protein
MEALWKVVNYGREDWPASARYSYDNLPRLPAGQCVFQVVETGHIELIDTFGACHVAHSGEAFLFRYGEASRYGLPVDNRLPYCTRWVVFEGAGLAEHWDVIIARERVIGLTTELAAAFAKLCNLADPRVRCDPCTMAAAVHALILQLISNARERERQTQSPVERAIDELLADPAAPWSLKSLAERHDISREHLTRVFQQRLGQPPGAWLNQERVAKAMQLLRLTDISVRDVAMQAGFSSTHTLARQIKDRTGCSPLQIRGRIRGKEGPQA